MFKGTAAAAEYPELLCVGVTRLMLREGIGCPPGSRPPAWMPKLPWLDAYVEEVRLVGELSLADQVHELVCPAAVAEGDENPVDGGLRAVRPALLVAQRRDAWCERMLRLHRWMSGGQSAGACGLLPGDVEKLKRQAVEFEVAPDGVLQKKLSGTGALGAATSVPVLPREGAVPASLAPEGAAADWTWRKWALFQAHSSLPGGHLKFEKALPRLTSSAWWEGMSKDLQEWISRCVTCLKFGSRSRSL